MSDLDLPPDARSDAIARVLSAVGPQPGTDVDPDRLRDALAEEGRSLVDLPEVGLFLALIQSIDQTPEVEPEPAVVVDATNPRRVVIDLRDPVADLPIAQLAAALLPAGPPPQVPGQLPLFDDELVEGAAGALAPIDRDGAEAVVEHPASGGDGPRGDIDPGPLAADMPVPDSPAPILEPPAPTPPAAPTPERQRRQGRLAAFLRSALGDPTVRRAVISELPSSAATPAPPSVPPATPTEQSAQAPTEQSAELPAGPPVLRLVPALDDSEPEPEPEPAPEPQREPDAELDPGWSRLELPDVDAPSVRLLAPDTTGHAHLDPWWPRHLVRDRLVGDLADLAERPPRDAATFETVARDALVPHLLVGAADLARLAPEAEAVLSSQRDVSLDELAATTPATLLLAVVDRAGRCADADAFDELTGVRPIACGPDLDRALRTALERALPRALPDRGPADVGVHERCFARLRFQAGLVPDEARSVVRAVVAASDAGAASGYEVARDWLLARSVVRDEVHPVVHRLLTASTQGRRLLDGMLHIVRLHDLGALGDQDAGATVDVVATADLLGVAPATATTVLATMRTLRRTDALPRRVQLELPDGDVPSARLPVGDARWLVNGELLAYGSPTTARSAALAPHRRGTWTITPGSSRRSPEHVGFRSRATDRIVLAFDERRRLVPGPLPLAGAVAHLVVQAGEPVSGELDRARLGGRWSAYDRVTVSLRGDVVVAGRGRDAVSLQVLADEATRVRGALGDERRAGRAVVRPPVLLSTRGPEPPAEAVLITVVDGDGPVDLSESRTLADPRWHRVRGAVRLDDALDAHGAGPRTVVVRRGDGIEDVHRIWWLPTDADAAWIDRPLTAAVADDWAVTARRAGATERWATHTGWRPDPDRAAAAAGRLVDELRSALRTPGAGADGSPLSVDGWRDAIAAESADLAATTRSWRRAAVQWRRRDASIRNLAPLFAHAGADEPSDAVLVLIAAALTAHGDERAVGRAIGSARQRLDEAARVAPRLVTAAELFALAYRRCQRDDPPSRFADLPLTTVG